jgi:hypothetical protein
MLGAFAELQEKDALSDLVVSFPQEEAMRSRFFVLA